MALPKIEPIETHHLDSWFAGIVDTLNYNLSKIEGSVPSLNKVLTTVDTAPIQHLKDSMTKLMDNINNGFDKIEDRLSKIESQIQTKNGGT